MCLVLTAQNQPTCLTALDHSIFLVKVLLAHFNFWKVDFTQKKPHKVRHKRVYYLCTHIKEQFFCSFTGKAIKAY